MLVKMMWMSKTRSLELVVSLILGIAVGAVIMAIFNSATAASITAFVMTVGMWGSE